MRRSPDPGNLQTYYNALDEWYNGDGKEGDPSKRSGKHHGIGASAQIAVLGTWHSGFERGYLRNRLIYIN